MGEDGSAMVDLLENNIEFRSDILTNNEDNKIEVNRLLNTLPKLTQKVVLTKLYVLDGNQPMTLKETGDSLGISREGVRQIKNKALYYLNRKVNK